MVEWQLALGNRLEFSEDIEQPVKGQVEIGEMLASCHLFMEDAMGALEFVIERRTCFGIPWLSRVKSENRSIDSFRTLQEAMERVGTKATALKAAFEQFDDTFSGAPERADR